LGAESQEELTQRAERAELADKSKTWNSIKCPNIEQYWL
jgi:hypothetical protein